MWLSPHEHKKPKNRNKSIIPLDLSATNSKHTLLFYWNDPNCLNINRIPASVAYQSFSGTSDRCEQAKHIEYRTQSLGLSTLIWCSQWISGTSYMHSIENAMKRTYENAHMYSVPIWNPIVQNIRNPCSCYCSYRNHCMWSRQNTCENYMPYLYTYMSNINITINARSRRCFVEKFSWGSKRKSL